MPRLSLLLISVTLLWVTTVKAALTEEADKDIKAAIRQAVKAGLNTIDKDLRDKYWQYLNKGELVHYNVQVLPEFLNYKLIYLSQNRIFRANCDLNKVTWKIHLNSLVKLPSNLVEKLHDKNYEELFLLDKDVHIIDAHKGKSKKGTKSTLKTQAKKAERGSSKNAKSGGKASGKG